MATITHIRTINYVAQLLGEDLELLEAIVSNDDNLIYGSIINVYDGSDVPITALTDDGMDELRQMLADARCSAEEWDSFLDCFVSDPDIIARVKMKYPR